MKEFFIDILKKADLWYWFTTEFGEDFEADEWFHDGWFFEEDAISYRECDIFDTYEDGYNWDFWYGKFWRVVLHHILLSHGFTQTHNSGDEEDGFYKMEKL